MSAVSDRLTRADRDAALGVAADAVCNVQDSWASLTGPALVRAVAETLPAPDPAVAFVLLACLGRRIPPLAAVTAFTREWRVEGPQTALARAYAAVPRLRRGRVEVVGGVIVDVTDTGRSRFTTGIQRVARATITRWARDHSVRLVSWSPRLGAYVATSPAETERVVLDPIVRARLVGEEGVVIVPFRSSFVLPEISVDAARTASIHAIARYSESRSTAIGFDCIPVTTSETSGPGMPGAFSKYLAALADFTGIAAISDAAAGEFEGWRAMLAGAGVGGPRVETRALPWQNEAADAADVEQVASAHGLDRSAPVVLAVGSHEPRKNHLNLLTAAELEWRRGHRFQLVLVGGNAWGDGEFRSMVARLIAAGRPIRLLSGVDDATVWALYALARFTVFCSVNEGFGLPVVESLASLTPVVTSDFGSMRQLGESNGAVLVSPFDVRAMAKAMDDLLVDDDLVGRLRDQAASLTRPDWDDYSDALWRMAAV